MLRPRILYSLYIYIYLYEFRRCFYPVGFMSPGAVTGNSLPQKRTPPRSVSYIARLVVSVPVNGKRASGMGRMNDPKETSLYYSRWKVIRRAAVYVTQLHLTSTTRFTVQKIFEQPSSLYVCACVIILCVSFLSVLYTTRVI